MSFNISSNELIVLGVAFNAAMICSFNPRTKASFTNDSSEIFPLRSNFRRTERLTLERFDNCSCVIFRARRCSFRHAAMSSSNSEGDLSDIIVNIIF